MFDSFAAICGWAFRLLVSGKRELHGRPESHQAAETKIDMMLDGNTMKLRVLVFEDDEPIRLMLHKLLERMGCEVFSYSSPQMCPLVQRQECLCHPQRPCADAVISDLNMPTMSGLELVASLRKCGCGVRRFLLASGDWTSADAARAFGMGCQVVAKPFNHELIRAWVENCRSAVDPNRTLQDWIWGGAPAPGRAA